MYWTKKHDELTNRFQLRPSTSQLWRWINRKIKSDTATEIEIDLKKFNQWIAKYRGKGYDPKTLKEALNQLLNQTDGLFVELKKITWYYYKIIVRPLSFVTQKKSAKSGKPPDLTDPKPPYPDASQKSCTEQQQQNISKVKTLFSKVNMSFTQDALNRIWRLSGKKLEPIRTTIELLLYRNRSTKIRNPHGFVMESLKHGWSEGFDIEYPDIKIPTFDYEGSLIQFVMENFRN